MFADPHRLAEERAALLRVATSVARGVPPHELFSAVTEEVGRLLGADLAGMIRFEADQEISAQATWTAAGRHPDVSGRWPLEGDRVATRILRTGLPTREDAWQEVDGPIAAVMRERLGVHSSVGSPVLVERRVWGALFVHLTRGATLPPDTESRLGQFTQLVATAIANAQAHMDLQRLAEEQSALRRVATLVARQPSQGPALATIAGEVGTLLAVDGSAILRYEADGTATVLAGWGEPAMPGYVDTRLPFEGDNPVAYVHRTWRPARQEGWADATGPFAEISRQVGITSSAAGPIVVERQLWGAVVVVSLQDSPLPADMERRIGQFTELVAAAMANVKARSDLTESRARIVRTADEARRGFERNLHDGIQQRLISVALDLRGVEAMLPAGLGEPRSEVARIVSTLSDALDELRELSRGLHPAILRQGGLGPALRALGRRSAVPVTLHVDVHGRLAEHLEATAYFVVSEALANAAKHARASGCVVSAKATGDRLYLSIRDDGVGGADPARGSGLIGLSDRVEAIEGTISIASPVGRGTTLHVALPLDEGQDSG